MPREIRAVDTQVAIAGAGPAGLLLALLLRRSGVRVTVLEQARTFEREFRGELLQPGAVRILGDLGLRERALALGGAFPTGIDVDFGRGPVHMDLPRNATTMGVDAITIVPQPQLLGLLADAVGDSADSSIVMGCAVRELLRDGAGRVVGIRGHLHDGETIDVRAQLVVACDGRFSAVRRAADIALRARGVPFDLLWFSTPIPDGLADRVYVRVLDDQLFAAFASRSNRMQVGWLVRQGAYAQLRERPFANALAHILDHVPAPLTDAVRASVHGWDDLALLPAVSQIAERWWKPGLLLLGDAAHPMSPAAGQGINVAIYDAVVAARHTVPALGDNAATDAAIAAVEREREPAVGRTQTAQNRLTSALYRFGPRATLRFASAMLRLAGRVPLGRMPGAGTTAHLFLWGEPEVRADSGPWHTASPQG